jgi:hypothetical protein
MEKEEKENDRTLLGKILKAIDPKTGEKLSYPDVWTNASVLLCHIYRKTLTS